MQFNGLPSLSNGYIVDGLETNDPLTNLNSGLSTNLVLGLNSIAEVTVNTLSYSVDQGRYGASQVNYVTKSGTNQFHGNLYELWNGSKFNAADFFTNATPGNHKPRSTVNHFGGSLGGPIVHDKLFFFFDSEWVRIALPIVTATTVPTPAFENYVLEQLPRGGVDAITGSTYQPAPQLVPFYQKLFSLYGNTPGTPLAVLGCPFNSRRSRRGRQSSQWKRLRQPAERFAFERRSRAGANRAHRLQHRHHEHGLVPLSVRHRTAGRLHRSDQSDLQRHLSAAALLLRRRLHARVLRASGELLQSRVLLVFEPVRTGRLRENIGGVSHRAGGQRRRMRRSLRSEAWTIPGCRAAAPRASSSTTISRGRVGSHEFRFGTNTRIFRLNDYDFGEGTVPLVTYTTLPQFIYGVASTASETFPLADSQPYNFLNLDFYAQDTWKVTHTFTWTFGIRDTYNSNPLNPHDAVARLAGSFASISHDVNQPLDAGDSDASRERVRFDAAGHPSAEDRDRLADRAAHRAAQRLRPVQRPPAGQRGRSVGTNPPYSKTFQGGLLGTVGGTAIAPGVPNSAIDATAAANQQFNSGFAQGRAFLRFAAGQSQRLPSADFDHRGSGWQAPCALLHAMELRPGTSDRQCTSICALSTWERAP